MISFRSETDVFSLSLSPFSPLSFQVFTLIRYIMNNWFWSPWARAIQQETDHFNPVLFGELVFLSTLVRHESSQKKHTRKKNHTRKQKLSLRATGQKCRVMTVQSTLVDWFWKPASELNSQHYLDYRRDRPLSRFCWARKRVNDFKLKRGLKEGQFRLDICKKSFKVRVVRHWHRQPREVADTPYLKTLNRFGVGLTNLIKLKMSLILAGGLD